jgi:uncharacterized protein (DUF362 family)
VDRDRVKTSKGVRARRARTPFVRLLVLGAAAVSLGCGGKSEGGPRDVVAIAQSNKPQPADLTTVDVADLVSSAVSQAGGLDFIKDGQTVVLKPNLPTLYTDAGENTADQTTNGVATDWRVVKAVADLVRAKDPTGKILVMEGATLPTPLTYSVLGYTADTLPSVDELIALEGSSCADTGTTDLEQRAGRSGTQYWVNRRYLTADVVISIPTLATDAWAGIGGAVESLGIGSTPAGQYGSGTNSIDCTRTKIDRSTPEATGAFIRDYYGLRPADFVVMDGLEGLEHGPLPVWDESGTYDYASSLENMRLIVAGRNAVAVDTIAASIMKCDPRKVPSLTKLEADGLGTTDASKIDVVGKQVADVAKAFAGKHTDICPGR